MHSNPKLTSVEKIGIKLYAWSTAFLKKLNHIRNDQELRVLRKVGALQALANFTSLTTPFLVSCSTFAVFVLTQKTPLTSDLIFPALTLFNLLTFPLAVLPLVITAVVEATVAVSRITAFLTADEVQSDAVLRHEAVSRTGAETVCVRDATFTWNKTNARPTLTNVRFSARKGELTCVVGRVGAGKSSLLQALLGDLWKVHGQVVVHGATAYVAQQSWIMNATVKENILFGHRWDPNFYEATIHACALTDDFRTLPDGDDTEVGERGISLSGGQRARLVLARAVYSRCDVFLLDDVLSAVDQHVGRHLIEKVLGPQGLLCGKTRILATNSILVLQDADQILFLDDGAIVERGSYADLMLADGNVANLVRSSARRSDAEDDGQEDRPDEIPSATVASPSTAEAQDTVTALEELPHLEPITSGRGPLRRSSTTTLRRASSISFRGPRGRHLDDDEEAKATSRTKQSRESGEQGKVKWSVYGEYARASDLRAVGVYLVMLIGNHTAQVGESVRTCCDRRSAHTCLRTEYIRVRW